MNHHVAKHSRHMLEATADRETLAAQLLARAVTNARFPTKRFRVEGSTVDNSRVLADRDADRTVAKYGGRKVELVTRAMYLVHQAVDLPACTVGGCLAAAGQPCKTKKGAACTAHVGRFGVPKPTPASVAQHLPKCGAPSCGAKAGQPCTSPKGKNRMPHKVRIPKVAEPGALL